MPRRLSRIKQEVIMATNKPAGDATRNGAVRKRSQSEVEIDGENHFAKRDKTTGEFLAEKDDEKFKGVRKE
jgi:hypothetical protein